MPNGDIPDYLTQGRQGSEPNPPVNTSAQTLPFGHLLWEDFEALCYRLALFEGDVEHAQPFGTRGQDQAGIDIYSRLTSGGYVTYQCKRYATFGDADVTKAVATFLKGSWAAKSQRFVLCTSHSMVRTQRANAIESAAKQLRERKRKSIAFEVWDAERLAVKLKSHPGLVREFFGQAWLDRFLPGAVEQDLAAQMATVQEQLEELRASKPYQRTRIVTLDWAPERLKVEFDRLRAGDSGLFELWVEHLGVPPDARLLGVAVEAVPPWLDDADADVWELLARSAESLGEWGTAALAWQRSGERRDVEGQARCLMAAAADADVMQDDVLRTELIEKARGIAPTHPRVLLEDIPQDVPGPEQLAKLLELQPDHPDDCAVIAGRLGVAFLLVPDVDSARDQLREVDEHAPGSAMSKGLAVSIQVQEGRLALLAGRPLDGQGLRRTQVEALELRDRLLREKRWEESARLLMLAADAACLLAERTEASTLLRQAEPAELASSTGAVVLADAAASRALDFRLGLELLGDRNDTEVERRIRAECLQEVGTAAQQAEALASLESLIEEGTDEAAEASFIRLAATLGGRHVPWHDEAERFLTEHGFERAAVTSRCFYLARWLSKYETAEALLKPHLGEPWAKITRLRLAIDRGKHSLIKEAADDLMSIGPLQAFRLDAGRGYAMARDFPRAKEVLVALAREQSAPGQVRAGAFRLLMRVVGAEMGDWKLARELHEEWLELTPGDSAASQWAPLVASRLRNQAGGRR